MPSKKDEQERKPLIKASEAVRLIRMGKTDLDLMEKYRISTKGLDSLFRKLVELGVIDQGELEQRKLFFQRVHDIDLVDPPQPALPVVAINTLEAADAIRRGVTDAELMEKFGISARGLESLFRKLVQAGAITETEITLRAVTLQKSHVVELTAAGDPSSIRATISPTDAVWAIRQGFSDAALMERYGISQQGLDSLFRELVQTRRVTSEELNRRDKYFQWADQAFPRLEDGPDPGDSKPESPAAGLAKPRGYRVSVALAAGCLFGMFVVVLSQLFLTGSIPGFHEPTVQPRQPLQSGRVVEESVAALHNQAEETLGMLKDILPTAGAIEAAGRECAGTAASMCETCLKECDRIFPGKDEEGHVRLMNCKGDCLSRFRKRLKRFRETHMQDHVDNE